MSNVRLPHPPPRAFCGVPGHVILSSHSSVPDPGSDAPPCSHHGFSSPAGPAGLPPSSCSSPLGCTPSPFTTLETRRGSVVGFKASVPCEHRPWFLTCTAGAAAGSNGKQIRGRRRQALAPYKRAGVKFKKLLLMMNIQQLSASSKRVH